MSRKLILSGAEGEVLNVVAVDGMVAVTLLMDPSEFFDTVNMASASNSTPKEKSLPARPVKAKLDAPAVREIRAGDPGKNSGHRWEYAVQMARRHNITPAAVSHVLNRRTWKRVRASRRRS